VGLQHARDSLTTGNVLQGQCMICLEELSASGKHVFTATSCYHFFHWACISSYLEHCRREFEERQTERKRINNLATTEDVFEVCNDTLLSFIYHTSNYECSATFY